LTLNHSKSNVRRTALNIAAHRRAGKRVRASEGPSQGTARSPHARRRAP
jgi:hypothetical protein